ncbi:MAG: hypothetical protein SGI71_11660 [Verrucomicrobiota bacterium]|nr:hypothetical protein [Verrucomicrobiota bacterium]
MGRLYFNTFFHTVDDKRRLTIPSEWRVENELYALAHPSDECVVVFPKETFDTFIKNLEESVAFSQEEKQKRIAWLCSNTSLVEIDKAGRIILQATQMEKAGITIKEEVALCGNNDRFKVFGKVQYARNNADLALNAVGFTKDFGI